MWCLNLVLCYIPENTCVGEESWVGGLLSFWPSNQGARSIEVGTAATKAGLSCTAVSKHRAVCGKKGRSVSSLLSYQSQV